jgi:hypothetical protein
MILEDRVQRLLDADFHLRQGAGQGINGQADACIMQAVDWIAGGCGKTDAPDCADSVISRFCIRLNDAPRFSQWRDELKPFARLIVGTNGSLALTRKRAFMASDWALRTIAPMAFDFWSEIDPKRADDARAWAKKLRDLAPVVDKASAQAGRETAREARDTAKAAGAVAYAAANAAADAAADAADTANAYAAYAADYADYAAAYAAANAARSKADAFSRAMWDESLRFLQQLIDAKLEVAA